MAFISYICIGKLKFHKMRYNDTYEELEEVLVEDKQDDVGKKAQLIVYNDDHNTFDWVIECFVAILEHTPEQSEQLALIIHFKGKATVKTSTRNVLKPFKDALIDRGLSAVIEESKK